MTVTSPEQMVGRPWLIRLRPVDRPRIRLFAFPYAGGSAWMFRKWMADLPPDLDLVAVEYPGRGVRLKEPLCADLGRLVDGVAGAIPPLLDRPFAFFGHSMGATIAFELTRRLRDRGGPLPQRLLLSGRGAPQLLRGRGIHHMDEAALLERLDALGGMPAEVRQNRDILEMFLPIVRADLEAIESWRHVEGAPVSAPITVFGGRRDPESSPEAIDGWADHSTVGVRRHLFEGGHFFLNDQHALLTRLILQEL